MGLSSSHQQPGVGATFTNRARATASPAYTFEPGWLSRNVAPHPAETRLTAFGGYFGGVDLGPTTPRRAVSAPGLS